MSLLINEAYANPGKPLWIGSAGGNVDGSLFVNGSVVCGYVDTDNIDILSNAQANTYKFANSVGIPGFSFITTSNTFTNFEALILSSKQEIDFVQGTGTPNTKLTLSAPGSGLDNLSVGGSVRMESLTAGAQMAGTASISVGTSSVVIPSTKVAANSLIFMSHIGAASAGPGAGAAQGNLTYRVADIVPGVSFTAYLVDITGVSIAASNVDATFVWMIVNQ